MSAHTKGPWRVDGRFVYGSGRKFPLAEFPPHGVVHSGVDAANARLMAAAPELLEALDDLLEAIPRQTDDADWWPDELTHAVRAARAAIAKAEGQ